MLEERALQGWANIARMLGVSKRTMIRKKKRLYEDGVIFYTLKGCPPHKIVCCFPSRLRSWIALQSEEGKKI